jgi:hypothetical protein
MVAKDGAERPAPVAGSLLSLASYEVVSGTITKLHLEDSEAQLWVLGTQVIEHWAVREGTCVSGT